MGEALKDFAVIPQSYQVLYEVNDRELLVTITGIRHRREAYRR
jgi:mRNA-degrading endonuclease RelE of RelBE toxin-antitoxin system